MDTSTLLVAFLLVIAATLASYALSHWSSIRSTTGGFGLAATSLGTMMLLAAAAIVVLTFVFRGPLWRPHLGTEQPLRKSVTASKEISARGLAASALLAEAAGTSAATVNPIARAINNRLDAEGSPPSRSNKQQAPETVATPSAEQSKPAQQLPVFKDDDPWAATRCVYVYNPGSDTTLWKIENGCDVPVGVVLSSCSENGDCRKHPDGPMIFPAKQQRPITLDEQTVHAHRVRYAACFVATSKATHLIGAPGEERSTASWREQFESARVSDGCLSRVQGNSVP